MPHMFNNFWGRQKKEDMFFMLCWEEKGQDREHMVKMMHGSTALYLTLTLGQVACRMLGTKVGISVLRKA